MSAQPLAVEVTGLHKSFKLPIERRYTLKERAVHPFGSDWVRELKVLDDISFQIRRGEFFGVVGRNASGKSTLLKLIASVYRADRGSIKVAGLVAPVIELGVGFQGELTARENVVTNALMMGLTAREARRRFDAVIEFAELEDFVDLKLMNYSSGMRARLAFAIVMQTDPDVLLLDEVLAVGDPPFQKRCEEAFAEIKRNRARTVLLVTHSMGHIQKHCDRAMLLEGGQIQEIGDPQTIGRSYGRLQSQLSPQAMAAKLPVASTAAADAPPPTFGKSPTEVLGARIVTKRGRPTDRAKPGGSIRLQVAVAARVPVEEPRLLLQISDQAGRPIFVPPRIDLSGQIDRLNEGGRIDVRVRIENKLSAGRYTATAVVATGPYGDYTDVSDPQTVSFEVPEDGSGMKGAVALDYDFRIDALSPERRGAKRRGRQP